MWGRTFAKILVGAALIAPNAFSTSDQVVRVRLKRQQEIVEISGLGLNITNLSLSTGYARVWIQRQGRGLWKIMREGEAHPRLVAGERVFVRGLALRLGMEPAPENLEIIANAKKGLDIIAHVGLEDYLVGVLPSEMPATWPEDALKAQAVSARSFALRQAFERRRKPFDVEATVYDQVYRYEKQKPQWSARVKSAIEETRGEVLVDSNHGVIKAFYSADCGCQSEDPSFVWGKVPGYESVKDPTCGKRRQTEWSFAIPRREVHSKLASEFKLPREAELVSVEVSGKTPSGRVREVVASVLVDGSLQLVRLGSQSFRRVFGFQKIRSTDFELSWNESALEVRGRGDGHGVGLCQRGARSLAVDGVNYRDILKLYYPKARLISPI